MAPRPIGGGRTPAPVNAATKVSNSMADAEKTRWGIVALCVAAGLVAAAHVGKAPPALPALRAELGLDLVLAGWIVSIFGFTGMALGIVAGSLADRVGHRRLLLIGLAALAAGSAVGGLASSGASLLASRFLEGLGLLSVTVSAPAMIAAAAPGRDRRLALGIWGSFMPAGMAAMMLISPAFLSTVGWRGLWQAAAILSLIWIVVMRRGTPPAPADDQAEVPPPLLHNVVSTISRPGPWLMSICFALYTVQWMSLMVWLPTFLIEQRTTGIGAAAAMTALVVVVNVAGNVGAGWMLRHNAPRWLLLVIAGATMGLAGLGIFSSAVPDAARYLLCLVFSGVGGMLPTSLLSAVPVFAPSPRQYATGNGFLTQGANVGQVIGPPAVAAMVAATGLWESASWLMAGTAGAIVVVALAIGAVERRLPAAGPAAPPNQVSDS